MDIRSQSGNIDVQYIEAQRGALDGNYTSQWRNGWTSQSGQINGHLKVFKSMDIGGRSGGADGDLTVVQWMAFGAQSGDIGKNTQ